MHLLLLPSTLPQYPRFITLLVRFFPCLAALLSLDNFVYLSRFTKPSKISSVPSDGRNRKEEKHVSSAYQGFGSDLLTNDHALQILRHEVQAIEILHPLPPKELVSAWYQFA